MQLRNQNGGQGTIGDAAQARTQLQSMLQLALELQLRSQRAAQLATRLQSNATAIELEGTQKLQRMQQNQYQTATQLRNSLLGADMAKNKDLIACVSPPPPH